MCFVCQATVTESPWRADPEAYLLVTGVQFLADCVQQDGYPEADINEV